MFSKFLSKHPFLHRLSFINLVSSILQCLSIILSFSLDFHFFYCYFFLQSLSPMNSSDFELCFAWFHVLLFCEIIFNILRLFSSFSWLLSTSNIIIISPAFLHHDLGFFVLIFSIFSHENLVSNSSQFQGSSLHHFPQHPNISFSSSLQRVSFSFYGFHPKFFLSIFVHFYSNVNKIFFS